ncbi:hypothetical protein D3C75_1048520 [compost metagenome]
MNDGVAIVELAATHDRLVGVVVPFVEIDEGPFDPGTTGGRMAILVTRIVVANDQLVLAAEELEGALCLQVYAGLFLPGAARATVQTHASARVLVREAPAGGGQLVVVTLDVHAVHGSLQAPVMSQLLLDACEGVEGILRVVAPACGTVGRAREIGLFAIAVEQWVGHG